jgi:hypothetical protein
VEKEQVIAETRSHMKFGFVILLCTELVLSANAMERVGMPREPALSQFETNAYSKCFSGSDIADSIRKLGGSYFEANDAKRVLLNTSKESPECRSQIITAVVAAMHKSNLDIAKDQASADLWRYGSQLLGEMKAAEALDFLISHLDLNDGEWSVTMTHQPVLGGIIQMGKIAVPKLRVVLRSEDPKLRRDAVYCLSFIGGTQALRTLQESLRTERDRCLKNFISVSIKSLRDKKNSLNSNEEWFSAFLCSGSQA